MNEMTPNRLTDFEPDNFAIYVAEDESNDLCGVLRPYRFDGRIVRKAQTLTITPNMIAEPVG